MHVDLNGTGVSPYSISVTWNGPSEQLRNIAFYILYYRRTPGQVRPCAMLRQALCYPPPPYLVMCPFVHGSPK